MPMKLSTVDSLLRYSLRHLRWHKLLPTTRWGDHLYTHLLSLLYNGHWPRTHGGNLNDLLAQMKLSPLVDSPQWKQLTDKETVKDHVASVLGHTWAVPTLAVLRTRRDIDSYVFPPRCVIKPTHASGEIIFRADGEPIDYPRLYRWLRLNHYRRTRERNYRGLPGKIIVEPWIALEGGLEYKIHCLRGVPRVLAVMERMPGGNLVTHARYDLDSGKPEPLYPQISGHTNPPPPPAAWPRLVEAARVLSARLPYARIDLYQSEDATYLGEITLINSNAIIAFVSQEALYSKLHLFGSQGFNLADFPELQTRQTNP